MGYIEELRKRIGHDPIILVGAAVLIIDNQCRILFIRRSDNECWGIPGGAMELGESLEDTARREVKEETGLDVGTMNLFRVFSGKDMFYEYPNGDQVYNVMAVYIANDFAGEVNVDQTEHTEHQYFDLGDLPTMISPPIIRAVKEFVEDRIK